MESQRSHDCHGKRLRAALYCAAGMIAPCDVADLEIQRIFNAFNSWKPGARKSLTPKKRAKAAEILYTGLKSRVA